jgi:hypothetical protein
MNHAEMQFEVQFVSASEHIFVQLSPPVIMKTSKTINNNNNNSGFYLSFSHLHIAQLTNIIEYLDK